MPRGHFDRSSRSDLPMTETVLALLSVGESSTQAQAKVGELTISKNLGPSVRSSDLPTAPKVQLESLILAQNER